VQGQPRPHAGRHRAVDVPAHGRRLGRLRLRILGDGQGVAHGQAVRRAAVARRSAPPRRGPRHAPQVPPGTQRRRAAPVGLLRLRRPLHRHRHRRRGRRLLRIRAEVEAVVRQPLPRLRARAGLLRRRLPPRRGFPVVAAPRPEAGAASPHQTAGAPRMAALRRRRLRPRLPLRHRPHRLPHGRHPPAAPDPDGRHHVRLLVLRRQRRRPRLCPPYAGPDAARVPRPVVDALRALVLGATSTTRRARAGRNSRRRSTCPR
jgi:hypothetical protein